MFNFVIDCSDSELDDYLNMDEKDAVRVFTRGDLNWCLQTYFILSKQNRLPVMCSNSLSDTAINIIHSDQLLKIKGNPTQFIVCIRADYPQRRWAQYHIVQNKNQLGDDTSYISHWVQPGLIKRDESRTGVNRVAYAGEISNGNFAGSVTSWKEALNPHGIEFVTLSGGSWHNLKDVDVLLGIRSFTSLTYDSKPPTKLFNAWHAHIPFIGGRDSAFLQVGQPDEDYLLTKTYDEAVAAVLKLKEDSALYSKLVKNGIDRTAQYNEGTIAQEWLDTLTGPVMRRYELWKSRPAYEQKLFKLKQYIGLSEHSIKQAVKKLVK